MLDFADPILRCLRWDEEGRERLRSLSGGDWTRLISLIVEGHGEHLLARRLQREGVSPPPEAAAALRARAFKTASRNLLLRAALTRMLKQVQRPILLLKGVDLADRLYGNVATRPMGDADFLVRREDVRSFDEYLRGIGSIANAVPDDAFLNSPTQHHVFYRTPERAALELHWRLSDDGDDVHIDLQSIWDRALPRPGFAPQAFVMAPEDLFLHLCLHLAHHTFETPLTQLWDIAELLHAPALRLDWPTVWQRAAEWKITKAVNMTLFLVRRQLGIDTSTMSSWEPELELAEHFPDGFSALGRFPYHDQVAGYRVAILFDRHSSVADRYHALREAVFPGRDEIRARFGSGKDGLMQDCRSYVEHWSGLFRRKGNVPGMVLRRDPEAQRHIARVAALRRFMKA